MDTDQQQVARETTACLIKLCVTCGQNYTERNLCAQCEREQRVRAMYGQKVQK